MGKGRQKEMPPVSYFRRILPQILAVSAKNTLVLNFGLSIAFPTIVMPALMKPHPDIVLTPEQLSWIGSLYFIVIPFGCLASGPLTHKFGRKTIMLALCVPFSGIWLLFAWANSPTMLFSALALHGFINGLMESPVLTYVGEVCEAEVRGPLASTTTLAALIGVSLQFLLANFFDWHHLAMINIAAPMISFVCLLFVPESPHWLVAKNRIDDVERSLRWLRGWVPASHVKKELELLRLNNNAEKVKSPFRIAPYMDPAFYKPFSLVVFTFFVGHFGGMSTLQTYAVSIFQSIKSPVDPYSATATEGFVQFGGALLCVLILPFVGRRTLAISCTLLTTGFLAILVFFGEGWPAFISLLASVFLINACSKVFPWILIGEVFTPGVRSVASGMATCIGYAMGFVVNYYWFFSLRIVGLQGMFISYAIVSLLGGAVYYLYLPETEGRTLEEVQSHFRGELDLIKTKHGKAQPTEDSVPGEINAAYTQDV